METKTIGAAAAEEETPEKKKTATEVTPVSKGYIEFLLKCPPKPSLSWDEEDAIFSFLDDPEEDADVRALRKRAEAKLSARIKAGYDREMAILKHYHDKGYAVMEIEDDDNEEEDDKGNKD